MTFLDLVVDWLEEHDYRYDYDMPYPVDPLGPNPLGNHLYIFHNDRSLYVNVATDNIAISSKNGNIYLPEHTIHASDPELFKKLSEYFITRKYYTLW